MTTWIAFGFEANSRAIFVFAITHHDITDVVFDIFSNHKFSFPLSEVALCVLYVVFPGFKLSTIIYEPPKGFSRQSPEWNYATRAHFDFVVCHTETRLPEFAIELDDPMHWKNPEVQRRDRMKNALCDAAGFELLRIESSALSISSRTGNRRLIEYLIDAWELGNAFYEQQKKGLIPEDEVYDYRNTIELNSESGRVEFVHDLAQPAIGLAFKLHDEGTIKGYFIERLHFYWRNGWAEGGRGCNTMASFTSLKHIECDLTTFIVV